MTEEEEEEEESERRREPGAVCSHLSSRSPLFSGRLGFVSVDAVVRGLSSDCLTADMDPSLRSRIAVCLVLTLARVIAVTGQEDAEKGG